MKILLVQPRNNNKMVGFSALFRLEPLGLELLAASVPEYEVKILDLRLDSTLEETLASFNPDVVGVTGYTTDVLQMNQICHSAKTHRQDVYTVVGGYHATLCPEDFNQDYVDFIVLGEGEITFKELLSFIEGGRDLAAIDGIIFRRGGQGIRTRPRQLLASLNDLPLPARHLTAAYRSEYSFHIWNNAYSVETSRGCPHRCSFCAVWKFHCGGYRRKSAEAVLRDVEGADHSVVCFVDDNFLQDMKRTGKLYELIKSSGIRSRYWIQARADSIVRRPDVVEKWSSIGLATALIGFEKFRDEELKVLHKRSSVKTNEEAVRILKANGVGIWGAFMVDPQWGESDFDALISYVNGLGIEFPQFTVLTPIPGTDLFRQKVGDIANLDFSIFDFLHSVLPTKLPLRDFYANMARLYAQTTLGFAQVRKRLRTGEISVPSFNRLRDLLRDVTNPDTYLIGHKAGRKAV